MLLVNKEDVKKALDNGDIVAVRTDTVYGLVGKAFDKNVEEKIYEIKNRDIKKPLILFIKNEAELKKYVKEIPEVAKELIHKYWPGALTLIFKKKFAKDNEQNTIGIRIPNDKELLELLQILDFPLVSTSANISGQKPSMSTKDVETMLGDRIKYIWDASELVGTKASTVVDVSNEQIKILRQGDIYV